MEACSGPATIQLIVAATIFLAAVVSLDMFWVRTADELRGPDVARVLRKRNWLDALVAAGGAGAAALLLFGASTC